MTETSPLLPKSNTAPFLGAIAGNIPEMGVQTPTDKNEKEGPTKLNTFEGVFLPTSLNVLSILMFLRFGFIIGQMGIFGTTLLLVMSYIINVLTVLSISAISTNGTVKGGGAYYMISRSLGPEFGGAIGIIFFIGQILNASLNVVGFIEPLLVNFGIPGGEFSSLLPLSYLWQIFYSTILLAVCTAVAMVGSSLVSKTAFGLFIVLTLSTLSIPLSALVIPPGYPLSYPHDDLKYTGIAWETFKENFWIHLTSGAAGSGQPPEVPETFRNMFGIFFPATAGIFAGASMSGELSNPSRSIPKGTLYGLLTSFVLYLLVIISLGASTPRELLHNDIKIIQSINIHGMIIILGEISTSLFSVIMGVVGAASMLNAIADDRIVPGLSCFALNKKLKAKKRRAEIKAIILTWFLAQLFLFADINQIATFITMAFLMTFLVTNLACFLLRVGSAPNFRPSFKYFNSKTAFTGGMCSIIAMYICDGVSATSVIIFLVSLILMIHYLTPPSKFGDISQLLIYHQVRKYLLRLKLQMSVKYWRPQILLLCDDPQTSWNLIGFCNHLKKGGLYILGHVVLLNDGTSKGDFEGQSSEFNVESFKEVRKQKNAWTKLRDMAKIKAFVQIAIGPTLPWGVRNVFLGSGLGGMKPNITVLGFFDYHKHGVEMPLISNMNQLKLHLPTDECRKEKRVSASLWVQIVEDLIIMQATVAVAANFQGLKLPTFNESWIKEKFLKKPRNEKRYIDLYPIQMSSVCLLEDGKSVLSTNFDTYTLILQLGSILSTVDEWSKNGYLLRVVVFVENQSEEEEERNRLESLLGSLRIDAEVKIVCFDDGSLTSYNLMVKAYTVTAQNQQAYTDILKVLEADAWWHNLVEARKILKQIKDQKMSRNNDKHSRAITIADDVSTRLSKFSLNPKSFTDSNLGKSLRNNRRYTLSNLHEQGVALSLNMKSQGGDMFFKQDDALESSDESDSEREQGMTHSSQASIKREKPPVSSRIGAPPAGLIEIGENSHKSSGKSGSTTPSKTSTSAFKARHMQDLGSKKPLSSRPSKVNLRPNFLAVKIPQAKIQDDEDDNENDEEADDNGLSKPSITFVPDREGAGLEYKFKDKPKPRELNLREPGEVHSGAPSILGGIAGHFKESLDDEGAEDVPLSPKTRLHHPGKQSQPTDTDKRTSYKQLQKELDEFTFNDLPAKGQHLILNELMKKTSRKEETAVIFSTLPAPMIGTHLNDDDSLDYVKDLAIWLDDLAPVVLMNSQTVTVTTSL